MGRRLPGRRLRADLDQADPSRPVDLDQLSDAVDAAAGGDTPALLTSLQRLGPQHAYRAASMAALDRRNALGILRGLTDTATLLTRAGKSLPAWRAIGALDQAAELLHTPAAISLPPTPPSSPPSPKQPVTVTKPSIRYSFLHDHLYKRRMRDSGIGRVQTLQAMLSGCGRRGPLGSAVMAGANCTVRAQRLWDPSFMREVRSSPAPASAVLAASRGKVDLRSRGRIHRARVAHALPRHRCWICDSRGYRRSPHRAITASLSVMRPAAQKFVR